MLLAGTVLHLNKDLKAASEALQQAHASIVVRAACEMFARYVARAWMDLQDFELLRAKLIERGAQFRANALASTQRIAEAAETFLRDGMTLLTHAYSPTVLAAVQRAVSQGKRVRVMVTESRPGDAGTRMVEALLALDVPVTVLADAHVAHVMAHVDVVMLGAEAVVENGGLLAKVGTFQLSIVAKSFKKPLYVCAQSFIFTRLYPLSQDEIPHNQGPTPPPGTDARLLELLAAHKASARSEGGEGDGAARLTLLNPLLDYTPPAYLTLLITDLGVLTPSAVSDELIKLYS